MKEIKKEITEDSIKKLLIMRIIDDNWTTYKKMSIEGFRNSVKEELRNRMGNENESLSHDEFYEILFEYMKNVRDKEKRW